MKATELIAILTTVCFISGFCHANDLPSVKAAKFAVPPKLDGELNDPCWKDCEEIGEFYVFKGKGEKKQDTLVKMGYDSKWLYLGIFNKHPLPERIEVKNLEHDSPVHKDESLEIFIEPGTDGKLYFHFKVNFANAKAEQRVTNVNKAKLRDVRWNVPWRSAVKMNKDGWGVEIAIPLYELGSYGDLSELKFNIVRNKVIPVIDPSGVAMGSNTEWSIWSPVKRSFHGAPRNRR